MQLLFLYALIFVLALLLQYTRAAALALILCVLAIYTASRPRIKPRPPAVDGDESARPGGNKKPADVECTTAGPPRCWCVSTFLDSTTSATRYRLETPGTVHIFDGRGAAEWLRNNPRDTYDGKTAAVQLFMNCKQQFTKNI